MAQASYIVYIIYANTYNIKLRYARRRGSEGPRDRFETAVECQSQSEPSDAVGLALRRSSLF